METDILKFNQLRCCNSIWINKSTMNFT